jgi:hypothetical protein
MEINKSNGFKAKNRAHKLQSGINWQGELKQFFLLFRLSDTMKLTHNNT